MIEMPTEGSVSAQAWMPGFCRCVGNDPWNVALKVVPLWAMKSRRYEALLLSVPAAASSCVM